MLRSNSGTSYAVHENGPLIVAGTFSLVKKIENLFIDQKYINEALGNRYSGGRV